MSNGVDFRKLAVDLRQQLNIKTAENEALQQRLNVADQRIDDLSAAPVPPQAEAKPVACTHEWTDDGEFLLVCTACGAQEDYSEALQLAFELGGTDDGAYHLEADELCEVLRLYTPADAVEIGRLREGISKHWQALIDMREERDTLRAQLAEANHLLTKIRDIEIHEGRLLWDSINNHLSATAEPAADLMALPSKEPIGEFEKFAKANHFNLQRSPYPDSFRLYKFDRTQHAWEGYCFAKGISATAEPAAVSQKSEGV